MIGSDFSFLMGRMVIFLDDVRLDMLLELLNLSLLDTASSSTQRRVRPVREMRAVHQAFPTLPREGGGWGGL